MPQGVLPAEQFANVPSTRVPVGSAFVRISAMAARGTVDVHRRVRGDAPVVTRGQIARPAVLIAIQLHHGDAVCRLHERHCLRMLIQPGLARIGLHAGAAVAGPDEFRVHIFMIDADQSARRAARDLRKVAHGIGIGAELPFLRGHGVSVQPVVGGEPARIEILRAGYKAVTPASHHVVAITIGDHERIVVLRRDAGEGAGPGAPALRRNVRTGGKSNGGGGAGDDGAARQARREHGFKGGSFHGRRMLTWRPFDEPSARNITDASRDCCECVRHGC